MFNEYRISNSLPEREQPAGVFAPRTSSFTFGANGFGGAYMARIVARGVSALLLQCCRNYAR